MLAGHDVRKSEFINLALSSFTNIGRTHVCPARFRRLGMQHLKRTDKNPYSHGTSNRERRAMTRDKLEKTI